jgi:hypothetical protein
MKNPWSAPAATAWTSGQGLGHETRAVIAPVALDRISSRSVKEPVWPVTFVTRLAAK